DSAMRVPSHCHLAALFDHLITVLADECGMQGEITFPVLGFVSPFKPKSSTYYRLVILCADSSLDQSVWDTLFAKNGRDLYLRRLEQYGGKLEMALIKNRGVIFGLDLPLTPKT
ncbi:MAG: hypothetical protein AAFQ07_17105, partial [Chloroflexota bacterium]